MGCPQFALWARHSTDQPRLQGQQSPRSFGQPVPSQPVKPQPSSPAVTPRTARLPDTGDAQWTSALAAPAREPELPVPEPDRAVKVEGLDPLVKAPLMADALQQQVRACAAADMHGSSHQDVRYPSVSRLGPKGCMAPAVWMLESKVAPTRPHHAKRYLLSQAVPHKPVQAVQP